MSPLPPLAMPGLPEVLIARRNGPAATERCIAHLYQAPPGTFKGPAKGGFNTLPIADMAPITIGGHKAYGVYIMPGMGFRNNNASGTRDQRRAGGHLLRHGRHALRQRLLLRLRQRRDRQPRRRPRHHGNHLFRHRHRLGHRERPRPVDQADFEGGVFSGYNAKQNAADPTIDSWRFVTAVVDGGGGNKWDLRGGNAQQGGLTTFYSGARPGSSNNANYFPMHKQGAILLGNGGDNGNGSSGTFYEGVDDDRLSDRSHHRCRCRPTSWPPSTTCSRWPCRGSRPSRRAPRRTSP